MPSHSFHKIAQVIAAFLLCLSSVSAAEKIDAVTEFLGQLQFVNQQGEIDGFAVEVAHAVSRRAGYELDIAMLPWARAYKTAQDQPNTLIFSVAKFPEREPKFKWIGILCRFPMIVWESASRPQVKINTLEDLRSGTFVTTKKSRVEAFLENHSFNKWFSVVGQDQIFGMLQKGRADYMISSDYMMTEKFAAHGFARNDFRQVYRLKDMHQELNLAFGLKTDPELVEAFKVAFEALEREKHIDNIRRKWGFRCA